MFWQLSLLVAVGLAGPALAVGTRNLGPTVIAELAAGVVIGHTGFALIDPAQQPLTSLKAIGFAMLMLRAGTHVDIGSREIRRGFTRGLTAFVIAAALAAPAGFLIDRGIGTGHAPLLVILIAGSSAAIAFPFIEEHRLSGDGVSQLIAWVAIADAVTVVVMPLTLGSGESIGNAVLGDAIMLAIGAGLLVAAPRIRSAPTSHRLGHESRRRGWALQLRVSILLLFGLSAIAERFGASSLVAGFLAGMVIVRFSEPKRLAQQLTGVANGFFVPIFFVLLGAELDLRALAASPSRILLAVALAAAAVVSHVGAGVIIRRRDLATGLAASAQLGLPAAAASLGLGTHLLTPADAAALVAAGCLTLIPATIGALLLASQGSTSAPSESPRRGSQRQ